MFKKIILFLVLVLVFTFTSFSQGDDCTTALQITNLSNNCSSNAAYTNASATAGTGLAVASCWNSASTADVWFYFIATGTEVLMTVNGSGLSTGATLKQPEIGLYTGTCSTTSPAFSEVICASGVLAGTNNISLYRAGLTLGTTYYIRVSTSTANRGKFDFCINNYTTVPNPNDPNDCNNASIICNKNAVSVGTFNGPGSNTTEANLGCFSAVGAGETNSNWLTFTCKTSGTLDFDIIGANASDDIDWMFMEIPGIRNCATKTVLSCNIASCDINGGNAQGNGVQRKTGVRPGESVASLVNGTTVTANSESSGCTSPANGYNDELSIVAGKTYVLFINNDVATSGFSVVWSGTSTFVGPVSNITVDKTTICVGQSITVDGSSSLNYTTFNWSLPSAASPTTQSAIGPFSQTFNSTGTYPIILTTHDNNGCLNTSSQLITVNGINPSFTAPAVCSGSPVVFTNTTPSVTSCAWDFGDGQTGSGTTVNHNYATAGQYSAKLTVTGGGCTNVFTQNVSVLGASLNITPAIPQTCPGNPITLNGTATVTGNISGTLNFSSTGSVSVPKTDGYSVGVDTDWDGSVGNNPPSYPASNIGTSTITTSGISTTNWSINSVTLNISTSKAKYLTVYLESPCGSRIKLVAQTSSLTGSFNSTVFTPSASTALSGALGAGPYAASELSKWNTNLLGCTNPNGTWKLLAAEYIYGSTGNAVITSWSMNFTTSVPNTLSSLAWSPTTNLSAINYTGVNTTSGTAVATTSTAGQITLTAKDNGGCTSTKSVTVSVSGPPAPTCAGPAVCSGTSASLTASGNTGATYTWYSAATGGSVLASTATFNTPTITTATSYWVSQTSGGCESSRTQVDVTIKTVETPTITCGTSTTNSVTFNWNSATGATSYNLSYNPGTGTITSSQPATSKIVSGLNIGQSIALTVTPVGTSCYSPATFTCTASNCSTPTITTQPSNSTKCSGTSTTFTVVQTGGSSYKWQVSTNGGSTYSDVVASTIYSGETTATLAISDVTGLTGNKYQVIVSPAVGTCSVTSTPVTLTVNPLPSATLSGNVTQCDNVSSPIVTFTGANGTAPYTFAYTKDGLGGSTLTTTSGNSATITIPATPASNTSYGITSVTDNNGCKQLITGQTNTITINPILTPSITCGTSTLTSVTYNWTACAGVTSYSISTNTGSGAQNQPNQTSLSYTLNGLTSGNSASITVTPNGTGCYTPATLSCTASNCSAPVITTQPSNSTKCAGTSTSFSVVQTGGSTYKWQVSTNGGSTYTDIVASGVYSGVTTTTLSISDVTGLNGNKYQIIIYPAIGTCSVTSNPALLTVNSLPSATISSNVSQCVNVSSPVVTFTGLNGTAPYTFAYTKNGIVSTPLTTTAGNSATITIPASPASQNSFAISNVTDNNGCTQAITGQSDTITIKVIETPIITCGNSTLTSVTYNWSACSNVTNYSISTNSGTGAQNQPNQTALSYTLNGLTSGSSASITITPNGTGCYSPATLSCTASNCPSPVINSHPVASTKCAGTSTSFSITQTGGTTFQWQVSTDGGSSFTDVVASNIYSNEKTISLTISDVTGLTGNLYRAKVTEASGTCSVISNPALLTVNALPTATISGTNAICIGKSTDLSVSFTGTAPWSYSYSDGTTTSSNSAISSSPTKITVSPNTTTTYTLVSVSDANCTGTVSGNAVITVNPLPVISPISDSTLCHKTNKATIQFVSTPSGANFNWTNSNSTIGLAGSGTGNIPKFEVQNITTTPVTSTIIVTPTLAGCVGSPVQFHLTINPFLTTKITTTDSTMTSISFAWSTVVGATGYDVSEVVNPSSSSNIFSPVTLPTPQSTTYTHSGLKMGDKMTLKVNPTGSSGTCFLPATISAMTDTCRKATIVTQPVSVNKCVTSTALFTFTAKGNDSISGIQWQVSKDGISWNNLNNTTPYSGVTTSTLNISNLNGLNGNRYRASVLGTINACEVFTNEAVLNVSPIPTANFSMNKSSGCVPLAVTFSDKSGYSDAKLTWDFGDGKSLTKNSDTILNVIHTFQIPDSFNVSLIVNRNGCSDTLTQKIKVMSPAIAKFSVDQSTLPLLNPSVQLTNLSSTNSVVYKWTFGDNSPISILKNPSHTFDAIPGSYIITLYTSSIPSFSDTSCISIYQQKITVLDDIIYYIPNTFTPNGDEINNTFQPIFYSGFDPQHYHLSIYDRWGELIFESYNTSYGWDGTYGNKLAETGTYVWKIQFKEKQTEKEHIETGHVNIVK